MTGIGLIVSYIGYALVYWAVQSFQGSTQDSFATYLLPFAKGSGGGIGLAPAASASTPTSSPADTTAKSKAPTTIRGSHGGTQN